MATLSNTAWAAIVLLLVSGCRRDGPVASGRNADTSELASNSSGYLAPPRVSGAKMVSKGDLLISGVAPREALVEITAPEGDRAHAQADKHGVWNVILPGGPARLYAISAVLGTRKVHAEGALVTAPGALSRAVIVRAGYAAMPMVGGGATNMATVDYDPQGSIAVAGEAPAGAKLTLVVDGAAAAVGEADTQGRYALMAANRRRTFGVHRLQVRAGVHLMDRMVTLEPPTPLSAPYEAWSTPQGWRVEWALNGGGVQTTLILSPLS